MSEYMYIIKVLDDAGEWKNTTFVNNKQDAIRVALFYKNQIGYKVQLWHEERNISHLLEETKAVSIRMTEERKQKLKIYAAEQGRTMSDVISEFIDGITEV